MSSSKLGNDFWSPLHIFDHLNPNAPVFSPISCSFLLLRFVRSKNRAFWLLMGLTLFSRIFSGTFLTSSYSLWLPLSRLIGRTMQEYKLTVVSIDGRTRSLEAEASLYIKSSYWPMTMLSRSCMGSIAPLEVLVLVYYQFNWFNFSMFLVMVFYVAFC